MTANEHAFHALVTKSLELGQPKHYTDDLYFHDRLALGLFSVPEPRYCFELKEGGQFLWIVRDCGTEIAGLATDGQVWNRDIARIYAQGLFSHDRYCCWWWNGMELEPIQIEEARRRLDLAHYHATREKGHSKMVNSWDLASCVTPSGCSPTCSTTSRTPTPGGIMLTPEQKQQCMEGHCPFCEGNNLMFERPSADGDDITREVECHECLTVWSVQYKHVDIVLVNPPPKDEQ